MGLCTICGRLLCTHTLIERGQTKEEMDRFLCEEENAIYDEVMNLKNSGDKQKLLAAEKKRIEAAKRHAHDVDVRSLTMKNKRRKRCPQKR